MYEYPKSGFSGAITDLIEQNKIYLDSNISKFKHCNVNVVNSVVAVYCGIAIQILILISVLNTDHIFIKIFQDMMITFDVNGSFIDYWIPSVNSTSNQWGSNTRRSCIYILVAFTVLA